CVHGWRHHGHMEAQSLASWNDFRAASDRSSSWRRSRVASPPDSSIWRIALDSGLYVVVYHVFTICRWRRWRVSRRSRPKRLSELRKLVSACADGGRLSRNRADFLSSSSTSSHIASIDPRSFTL